MLQTITPVRRTTPAHLLRTTIVLIFLLVFLFPVVVRASLYLAGNHPMSWRDANWSSSGMLPAARAYPPARVLFLSGRTGGLKGVVAVHSWIVVKQANAAAWTRYDVAGWGDPVKINNWAPDGRWYGSMPVVVADVSGLQAEALIPRIEAAVKDYQYDHAGDYRVWPGPNSNTFTASVLRAVPELRAELPPNAVGRDFRPLPYAGLTGSGTGVELNLWGLLGIKIGLVEGIEINVLGLVAGIDFLHPALKLPAFGLIGPAQARPSIASR
jgi:hypothetical protein